MDVSHARPQLPALSFLDAERKSKREEEDSHHSRASAAPQTLSTGVSASPTYHCPPGPPPPYSHAHSAPSPAQHPPPWPAMPAAVQTPPESRRASEHENANATHNPTRQSLPSLSEALGVDSQTVFASGAGPHPPLSATHRHSSHPLTPSSPGAGARRSHPMELLPTSIPSSSTLAQYATFRSDSAQPSQSQQPASATEPHRPLAVPSSIESKPQPARPSSRSGPSAAFDHSSQAGGAPTTGFAYGYTSYPPRYANPTASTSASSSGPIYQASAAPYTSSQAPLRGWVTENAGRFESPSGTQEAPYGESVKRHLDMYDLEQSLNEIASTSGILSDFSRRYGDRMHSTQRTGSVLSTLPGIVEVDDMVLKARVQLDSLLKIRDVIITQQAVFEQQAADQRHHKTFAENPQTPSIGRLTETDDTKTGGFAGSDTKKRRGRAAPPGRCHSCNRAETPEWRRGPDGARTLCNACGLHYAKLTRKNNGANKNTNLGSSNLRPKENMS